MSETNVINIYHKVPFDVYIGRGSIFGNPYTHMPLANTKAEFQVATRDEAVKKYKEYFENRLMTDDNFLFEVSKLKGKTLGCYCHPKSCHGDIIKEFVDKL